MNTPITDDAWYHNADHISAVDASLARRLETDRAALMHALEAAIRSMKRVNGENDCSRSIDAAESALDAARTNFPQP